MSGAKVVGIDVGKKELHAAHRYYTANGKVKVKRKKFPNTATGHKALLSWSKGLLKKETGKDLYFVMEATGVYYESIATFLHDNGFRVSVVNPKYIKSFAESSGVRTKTDTKDALVLVDYGTAMAPDLWTPLNIVFY